MLTTKLSVLLSHFTLVVVHFRSIYVVHFWYKVEKRNFCTLFYYQAFAIFRLHIESTLSQLRLVHFRYYCPPEPKYSPRSDNSTSYRVLNTCKYTVEVAKMSSEAPISLACAGLRKLIISNSSSLPPLLEGYVELEALSNVLNAHGFLISSESLAAVIRTFTVASPIYTRYRSGFEYIRSFKSLNVQLASKYGVERSVKPCIISMTKLLSPTPITLAIRKREHEYALLQEKFEVLARQVATWMNGTTHCSAITAVENERAAAQSAIDVLSEKISVLYKEKEAILQRVAVLEREQKLVQLNITVIEDEQASLKLHAVPLETSSSIQLTGTCENRSPRAPPAPRVTSAACAALHRRIASGCWTTLSSPTTLPTIPTPH